MGIGFGLKACGTISEVLGLSRDGSPRIWRRRNKYVHPRAGEVLTNNHQVLERASENSVPSSLNTKKERGWLVGHLRMKVISISAAVANQEAHCVESLAG
jgi:hypothetical protein